MDGSQALMEDNEDEYRKLVKEKKDSRLNMLLEKTDGYVKSFSELVAKRRRAQLEKVHTPPCPRVYGCPRSLHAARCMHRRPAMRRRRRRRSRAWTRKPSRHVRST
jgi:hypothetical protein